MGCTTWTSCESDALPCQLNAVDTTAPPDRGTSTSSVHGSSQSQSVESVDGVETVRKFEEKAMYRIWKPHLLRLLTSLLCLTFSSARTKLESSATHNRQANLEQCLYRRSTIVRGHIDLGEEK